MKKKLLTIIMVLLAVNCSFAQWVVQTDNNNYNTNSGNVVIGTAPDHGAKFVVYNSYPIPSTVKSVYLLTKMSSICGVGNNLQNNLWLVRNAAGTDWTTIHLHDAISIDGSFTSPQVNTRTFWERDPYNDVQSWGSNATNYLTISKGNVGIGTTDNANWTLATSTYKLAVAGSVVATSITVKLQAAWPDYVFEKGYQLPSLAEVRTYINKNHHLSGLPSASETNSKGLNLGEIDNSLTRKIEELTLYLIEKDQQLKQQKEINDKQQVEIDKLQQEVADIAKKLGGK